MNRDRHPDGPRGRFLKQPRRLVVRRVTGFVIAFALVLILAFDDGGYDSVLRGEVGLLAWVAIAIGVAVGFLPRARLNAAALWACGGLAALAALSLLSMAWTESDERTFAEVVRVLQYLGVVLLAYLALNAYTWRGAAAGLAAAALVVPVFSVASRLDPGLFTDETAQLLLTDRLSYPFGYWNAVGAWGAMAVAIGLCWSAHAKLVAVRSLALAAVPVAALSVYLSYSRGGVLATALALVAALALSRNRWTVSLNAAVAAAATGLAILVVRDHDQIARATGDEGAGAVLMVLLLGCAACAGVAALAARAGIDEMRLPKATGRTAAAVAVGCALLAVAALNGPIGDAWDEFRNERTTAGGADPASRLGSAGGTRYEVWTTAIDAFESDESRGIGAGSYEFFWARKGETAEFVRDGHSLYFETLGELGIPGILCLLAALGGLGLAAIRSPAGPARVHDKGAAAALTAAFVVFLFSAGIDWMWELGAVGMLAIGGAAVAGAGGLERTGGWKLASHPELTGLVRWGLAAGAILVAAIQVPEIVSVERSRAADAARVQGNLESGRRLADEAVRAEPWAASPYAVRALIAERDDRLDDARADLREAIDREPTNFRHHLQLARLEARAGDRAAAQRELAEARKDAPKSPLLAPGSPEIAEIEAMPGPARAGPGNRPKGGS